MTIEQLITDPYNRKARLQPALLAMLPAAVVAVILVPDLQTKWAAVLGALVYFGGAMWLTQLGRDRGKKLEKGLFSNWGGKPTVAMLRHSDPRLPKGTKDRYRKFLQRNVPDLELPSSEEEAKDPELADALYVNASGWLLSQTRDRQRFRLIFEENVNYGFRRNFWATKPFALLVDAIVITGLIGLALWDWQGSLRATLKAIPFNIWLGLFVTLAHMIAIVVIVRADWVRTPADAFAQQLLAACDVLQDKTPQS